MQLLHSLLSGEALYRTQRNTEITNNGNEDSTTSFPHIELLRGRDGRDGLAGRDGKDGEKGDRGHIGIQGPPGLQGPPGSPAPNSGGVLYTRWGRTTCPSTPGTELVYAGRVGGTWWNTEGGGANYLCMPENPEYSSYIPGVQNYNPIHGTEYQLFAGGPLRAVHDHNVPCVVCFSSLRESVLMLPAKLTCPPSWTLEYAGYLMATWAEPHHHRTMFECVDKNPECVPGSAASTDGAVFYQAEANCNGMPCPPYDPQKELTCAVCTK